jgi:regulator of protease activity HflC (stomatin/prohibitin superfamily)
MRAVRCAKDYDRLFPGRRPLDIVIVRPTTENLTTVRRLRGIEYRVFEDSDDIHDLINMEVRRELEEDLESIGRDTLNDALLNSLPKRKWRLEVVNVSNVRLNPPILNSCDVKTGRKFTERLAERRLELRRALEARGAVIWPIVLLREENLLIDGYCRHSTLQEMGIHETYAYVGTSIVR